LLEFRIFFVDYIEFPFAANNLAISASFLDGCSYFHVFILISIYLKFTGLFIPEGDPGLCQIVWTHFQLHFITWQNFDVVHPHFTGNMCCHNVSVFKFNPEHGVAQCFNNGSVNFYIRLFRHFLSLLHHHRVGSPAFDSSGLHQTIVMTVEKVGFNLLQGI
jgi:hypothetical protein